MNRWGLRFDLVMALLGFAYFLKWAQFPWHLAMLAGLAVGVASFSTRRTLGDLRQLFSEPESGVEEAEEASERTSSGSSGPGT